MLHLSTDRLKSVVLLTAGDRSQNQKRFRAIRNRVRQRSVRGFMRQIFFAGEESQKRPALLRDVVADRPPEHWITRLQCIKDRTERHRTLNIELHLVVDSRQSSQMVRKHDSDQGNT